MLYVSSVSSIFVMHVCMHGHCMHSCIEFFVVKSIFLLSSSCHQISKNLFALKVLIPLCLCPHISMLIDDLVILKMINWHDDVVFVFLKFVFDEIDDIVVMYEGFCLIFSCLFYVEYENCLHKMVWIFLGSFVICSCPWLVMSLLN